MYHRHGFDQADFEKLFSQAGLRCTHAKSCFRMRHPRRAHDGEVHGHGHGHGKGLGEEGNEYPIIFAVGVKEE